MSRRDTFVGRNIDWMTLVLTMALMLIGWLMIYAVSYDPQNIESSSFVSGIVLKQAVFILLSLLIIFVTYIIDWKFWQTFSYPIYAIAILGLLLLFILGHEIKGAKSWFRIFLLHYSLQSLQNLQPALSWHPTLVDLILIFEILEPSLPLLDYFYYQWL